VTLDDLLTEHGAASWDKQMCLMEMTDENRWNLDTKRGELSFGSRLTFPVQFLGTEAEDAQTWLWAWANEASRLPPALVTASRQLEEFGRQNGVAALSDPESSLEDVNGHLLSLIASGLCGADAYYRGPYDGGALFLLLSAPEARQQDDPATTAFVRNFLGFTSTYSCEHRPALAAYARYKAYTCTDQPDGSLLCVSPSGDPATATFDERGVVTQLRAKISPQSTEANAEAKPEPAATKKPWWKLGR